eukprot:9427265-Pyramimonas_sp.AAC.1
MIRSMFRHLYDPIRKEQIGGKTPSWLVTLRAKQQAAGAPRRAAAPTPPAACAADSTTTTQYKVDYDATTRVAFRRAKGTAPEPTVDIYAEEDAKGHHFMWA